MASSDKQQINKVLDGINTAWLQGRVEDLGRFFHRDIVMVHPDFQHRSEGKERCIESFKDFRRRAAVQNYKESNRAIDVFGKTAVATYRFEITYEMNGKALREAGRDLFVLTRERGNWQAIWRTMVLISSEKLERQASEIRAHTAAKASK